MNNSLQGATMVRFGMFEAMMSGNLKDSDDGKPTWKVWWTFDEEKPKKLRENLSREDAVGVAQRLATAWRSLGRPELTEADLDKLVKMTQ